MNVHSGYFANPKTHHNGWFAVFRGKHILEVWFGHRYVTVSWSK
jgi:hypothetical protein